MKTSETQHHRQNYTVEVAMQQIMTKKIDKQTFTFCVHVAISIVPSNNYLKQCQQDKHFDSKVDINLMLGYMLTKTIDAQVASYE